MAAILDGRIAPDHQIARRRHEPPAAVAEQVDIDRHRHFGRREGGLLAPDIGAPILVDGEQTDQRRGLLERHGDFVTATDEHRPHYRIWVVVKV